MSTFTAGEQEFFAQNRFANEPGHCPQCRSAQKRQRSGGGMACDNDHSYSGGGYSRGPREMFEAICTWCANDIIEPA